MAWGQPPKLTPQVATIICDAVREGCYLTVAAKRAGIIPYTLYLWMERGKRESKHRAWMDATGQPLETPLSRWEQFYLMLEAAKGEARYNAETRVFQTAPLFWLKNGYARNDWREAGSRDVVDADEAAAARLPDAAYGLTPAIAPPAHPPIPTVEEMVQRIKGSPRVRGRKEEDAESA